MCRRNVNAIVTSYFHGVVEKKRDSQNELLFCVCQVIYAVMLKKTKNAVNHISRKFDSLEKFVHASVGFYALSDGRTGQINQT